MTATIVDFRVHQLKGARPEYQEPVPRGRAKRRARRTVGKASVDQQIAHVSWLLRELQDIWRGLPQGLVAEAHASIERTRKMHQSWPGATTSGTTVSTAKDAAQPNIDHALLERMYRDLGLHP